MKNDGKGRSIKRAAIILAACIAADCEWNHTRAQGPIPAPPARSGNILDVSAHPILKTMQPSRITLDFDNQPARQAASLFSAASPVPVEIVRTAIDLDQQLATLHLRDALFLDGLLQFRHQTHTLIRQATPTMISLGYAGPDDGVPLWCVAGPFAVTYQGMSRMIAFRGASRGGGPPLSRATMVFDFLAEPHLTINRAMETIKFETLEDEKGQAIAVQPASRGGAGRQLNVEVTLPENPGRRIPLMKGTVPVTLMVTEPVESPDPMQQHVQVIKGMTVTVKPLVQQETSPTFRRFSVNYYRGDYPAEKWKEMTDALPNARLKFRAINPTSGSTIGTFAPSPRPVPEGDNLLVNYTVSVPPGAGTPAGLTIDVPVELQHIDVPFEFRDLILP